VATPNQPRWIIAGHPSSQPEIVANDLNLGTSQVIAVTSSSQIPKDFENLDACALLVNAKSGVSPAMIELWSNISERQIPRMIIVNGLEFSEIDFDDIVLIANRVLENVITPFLVLHDELGEPTGLISLTDGIVHDYSNGQLTTYEADEELKSLVKEFRDELNLATTEFDETAYSQGLIVPAIPFIPSKQIGRSEIRKLANLLTRR
jgi:translation elongation factor EF-G